MCNMKYLLLISGIILWASQACGATYYIDPTCSSTGDGTMQNCGAHGPFKTWAEVVWAPGNTYSQKGGSTFYGTITVGASGTAGNPITINSYGTGNANLYGGVVIPAVSWTANDPVAGVYSITSYGHVTLEDSVFLMQASNSSCTDGNQYFASGYKNYYKPTSRTPADHIVEKPLNAGIELGTKSYITITGFTFCKYRTGISGTLTTSGTGNYNISITGNVFSNCEFGASLSTNNFTSPNNVVSNNSFDSIFSSIELGVAAVDTGGTGNFSGTTIANNTISHCSQVLGASYDWDIADKTGWDKEGIGTQNIISSRIYGNNETGHCRGIVTYVGNGSDGSNNNIYNNYIKTTLAPVILQPSSPAPSFGNNNVYTNIFIGGGSDGWNGAAVLGNGATPSGIYNTFYNNTLIPDVNGIYVLGDYYKIKNNIVYGGVNYYAIMAHPHVVFDYNLYYNNTLNLWSLNGSSVYFPAWKIAGFDTHSLTVDPKFTNASGALSLPSDFTLQPNSPAIGTGINVGLTTDYARNPEYNPPSIGAYEVFLHEPTGLRLNRSQEIGHE